LLTRVILVDSAAIVGRWVYGNRNGCRVDVEWMQLSGGKIDGLVLVEEVVGKKKRFVERLREPLYLAMIRKRMVLACCWSLKLISEQVIGCEQQFTILKPGNTNGINGCESQSELHTVFRQIFASGLALWRIRRMQALSHRGKPFVRSTVHLLQRPRIAMLARSPATK
jgi:hypothetical protein